MMLMIAATMTMKPNLYRIPTLMPDLIDFSVKFYYYIFYTSEFHLTLLILCTADIYFINHYGNMATENIRESRHMFFFPL
jgi:hypothetical protein